MIQPIRAIIVDDEALARDVVRTMLGDDADIEVVAECRNGREAVEKIKQLMPDLIFLDIQMPDLNGFGVMKEIGVKRMPTTIFVTAFDQYALDAFQTHALDYLLKPFNHQRFNDALSRAKRNIKLQKSEEINERLISLLEKLGDKHKSIESGERTQIQPQADYLKRLAIKESGRISFLKVEEIEWIEAKGDYVHIHTGKKSHLLRATMRNLAGKLDSKKFLRIHRSTIVNVESIKDIQPLFKGDYIVTLKNGKQLKFSRNYRDNLQELLNQML